MTIRYLEIFVEVCKQMNMSKAAQSLMISQSSVSQAVAALEKEYGTILFERLNHSLYLTKAGEQMLYLSSQVLKSVSQMEKTMKLGNTVPTLNIGVCTTIGSCLLHPLLAAYRKRCGAVHVSAVWERYGLSFETGIFQPRAVSETGLVLQQHRRNKAGRHSPGRSGGYV